jgi:hypothetical protein
VGGTGYISLTDAINDQQGSILIDDLDAGAAVSGFVATFKLRMGGGSGNAADGFSFNFANDLPDGTFGEEGAGTGLTVTFDIYDNGGMEAPAIDLKLGGSVIQSTPFAKPDILTGGEFVDVRIEWRNGLVSVDFKGEPVYTDVPLGMAPVSGGRFGLGARTGGENNNHWIDDLSIETFVGTAPLVSAIRPTAKWVAVQLQENAASPVNTASVMATIDGAPAVGTTVKSGEVTTFVYTNTAVYEAGSTHEMVLSYTHGTPPVSAMQTFSFTVPDFVAVPASAALPAGTIDTSQRGFHWRVHQVDLAGTLPNSTIRTEDQLSGLLGDNVAEPTITGPASGPAAAPSPASAPITFTIPTVINLSQAEGEANGNATPDLQMPGIPGTTGSTDNIAAEILTALEFPAPGMYVMIVNSDDGFRTSAGANPRDVTNPTLGFFEGGRGADDTVFHVNIEAAGIYGFRTIWQEGNGGANIEWLTELPDGSRVLINDTDANPQAIRGYLLPLDTLPAYVGHVSPAAGQIMLNRPASVEAILVDAGTQVNNTGITLRLNGTEVPVTINKSGNRTTVTHTVQGDLLPSTHYTAELSYTDTAGPQTRTWQFTTGPLSSTLFVIEAEDFDYDGGLANPMEGVEGQDVNVMPYLGGAYDQLSAIEGIDFVNADGFDSDMYRQELGDDGDHEVNIASSLGVAAGNGAGGTIPINSSDRVSYSVTANYRIGWVGAGEWQNYTREFPDNGVGNWWKVYAALSYGGTGDGQLSGSLAVVTNGVGTTEQGTEVVGQFGAPGSGGWGNNNLVPMKTAAGADALVKLVGETTVRFNLSSGDFDFLIFSAAPPPPPGVESTPQDDMKRNEVVLDWVLRDTDSAVNASTIRVFVDGEDVTAQATAEKTATGATIHLDRTGTMHDAGEHTWRLTFSDNSTPPQNVEATGTFIVNPYPTEGVFVIEAEDFNYSEDGVTGGRTNPQAGTEGLDVNVMPYNGGAYAGLSAVEGVDYNNGDANDSDMYRTELDENGENEVNIGGANGTRFGNDRGVFETTDNFRIGWVGAGEWQNYTRTFPEGTFSVWAALSFDGRAEGQLNGSLDLVTSDPAQPNQTVEQLGTFSGAGSGGWGRNELVPMKDAEGDIAVVPMGGVQTVRFNLGSGDFDYLLFVPASAQQEIMITRVARNADGSITIEWTGGGTLQAAPAVTGPWTDVPGAASPYTFTPSQAILFGRIRQ